jgi:FkbM family methyltransferase
MLDALIWQLARAYAGLYGFVKDRTGRNIPGLGRVQRLVHREHPFELAGLRFNFHPRLAGSYDRMIAGAFNEPQTRQLLLYILDRLSSPVTFVDVGANVGEFLITTAAHPGISRAIGFEAHPLCSAACRDAISTNRLEHVEVREVIVADGAEYGFHAQTINPNSSAIGHHDNVQRSVRLDDELADVSGNAVILIDVEGAEPLVFAGGREFIGRARPLVIFEYNYVSRSHYRLEQIRPFLEGYRIWRARDDGRLDEEVERSWNCIAIPVGSEFESICDGLVVRSSV